jgi:hypothetical protein
LTVTACLADGAPKHLDGDAAIADPWLLVVELQGLQIVAVSVAARYVWQRQEPALAAAVPLRFVAAGSARWRL